MKLNGTTTGRRGGVRTARGRLMGWSRLMTSELQQARIEAAAKAMWERTPRKDDPTWADLDYGIKEIWRKDARAALAAADALLPSAGQIAEELSKHHFVHGIGRGNSCHCGARLGEFAEYRSHEADAILALLNGENE